MYSYSLMALLPGMFSSLPSADVVIGSSVHPFAAFSAWLVSRRLGVPFIFEIRDLWPETLIQMGVLKKDAAAAHMFYFLERFLCSKAVRVITLLPRAANYLESIGVDREKIVWVPNGAEPCSDLEPLPFPRHEPRFTFMYVGSHGRANDLEPILDALKIVQERGALVPWRFVFVGEGPEKDRLCRIAHEKGLEPSVEFRGPVPKEAVCKVLMEADCCVIMVKNLPQLYQYGISMNKIFDYMAAARPVIMAADVPDTPIEQAGCGLLIPPGSPSHLAQALIDVMEMSYDHRTELGRKGYEYLKEHFSYGVLARRLARMLDLVCIETGSVRE